MSITLRIILGGIGLLLLLLLGVFAFFPYNIVTSKYATLEEARKDELFGRGWLPDILPPSSRDILVENDLDLNISEGSFKFSSNENDLLRTKLTSALPNRAPFERWDDIVEKRKRQNYSYGAYYEEDSTWVFFCKYEKGECDYVMWVGRKN